MSAQTFSLGSPINPHAGYPLEDAEDLDDRYADAIRHRVISSLMTPEQAVSTLRKHGWTLGAARRELAGFED